MKQLSLALLFALVPVSILAFQEPNDLECTTDFSDYAGDFDNALQNSGYKEPLLITLTKTVVAQDAQLKSQKTELQEVRGALQRQSAHIDQLVNNFDARERASIHRLVDDFAGKERERQEALNKLKSESDIAAYKLSSAQFASSQASWKFNTTVSNRDAHVGALYTAILLGAGTTLMTVCSESIKKMAEPVIALPLALCTLVAGYASYKAVALDKEIQTSLDELRIAEKKEATKQDEFKTTQDKLYTKAVQSALDTADKHQN